MAGGVGGARLVDGLAAVLPRQSLTVIVNTADDFTHLGMRISPDLDTVCYTLARLANPRTGWGRDHETWHMLDELQQLGGPTWFRMGDRDLATHLERTRRLAAGERLSAITADFCTAWRVRTAVLPMTDQAVSTIVDTKEMGPLTFQAYFVMHGWRPRITGFRLKGIRSARPAPGLLSALAGADGVIICPSNPWVSISPILAVKGIRAALEGKKIIAVSPIIGGRAVRGPAAKMYRELGIHPSALAVARHYEGLASHFVLDRVDSPLVASIRKLGMAPVITQTMMKSSTGRRRLAQVVLHSIGYKR